MKIMETIGMIIIISGAFMLAALYIILKYKGEVIAKFNFKTGEMEIDKKAVGKEKSELIDLSAGAGEFLEESQ